jgi:hypothetical protein
MLPVLIQADYEGGLTEEEWLARSGHTEESLLNLLDGQTTESVSQLGEIFDFCLHNAWMEIRPVHLAGDRL